MKTESKVLASFLAAAVWADGEYDENEKGFVEELAEGPGVATLGADLSDAIAATENMTEDELADKLEADAKKVAKNENEGVLTLCLQMMCADAYLSKDEVENYFAFAEMLGIDDDKAEAMLDEFIDEEEDLIIE